MQRTHCLGLSRVLASVTLLLASTCAFAQETTKELKVNDEGGIAGPPPPCQIQCPPNAIPENEVPCGTNTVNCGCDCPAPYNFQTLRCNEGYCSETWAMNGAQDTDWYNVLVGSDANGDGQAYICLTLIPEFPAVIEIYSGNCGGLTLLAKDEASGCTAKTVCACVAAPGQYKVKVYPGTLAGGPIYNGLFCGTIGRKYTIRLICNDACPDSGACCYQQPGAAYQCIITSPGACAQLPNSTYLGNGSTCPPNGCNPPPPTGACCYINAAGIPNCVITTQAACASLPGSTYLGDGSVCAPGICDPPPVVGACCYIGSDGTPQCTITTQANCLQNLNGAYQGDGTTCTPDPCSPPNGACCYVNPAVPGTQCVITTAQDCHNIYNGVYQGNGTTCTPDPCNPTGACCYQLIGSTSFACIITTQSDCLQNYFNSTYIGNGTSCTPDPCPPQYGACCYPAPPPSTGNQCSLTTLADCNVLNGTWLGAGSSCLGPPDPCNPPPPVGACCFKDGPAVGYQCVITTQATCVNNYPNGVYQGDGTTCTPFPCPDSGACCYQIPGTIVYTCAILSPPDCTQLNGTYLGNNTTCANTHCGPCHPPPPNMKGWWTFDETAGPIANESVANQDALYMPTPTTGPTPTPGIVQNALFFDGVDDYVQTPPNGWLNLGTSDFTVDAWIYWLPSANIVNPEICTQTGYRFRLVTSMQNTCAPAGLLLWLTGSPGGHKCLKFGVVPCAQWVHVAATIKQATSPTANDGICKLYVNGVLVKTDANIPLNNMSTNGLVRAGTSLLAQPSMQFYGNMDELEIFNRTLSQQEIQDIMNLGKCKLHCGGEWESPYCLQSNSLIANMTVCNDAGTPQSIMLSFQGIPPIPNTLCNGPLLTGFSVIGPNPVIVPPGQCISVPVQITRPPGLVPGMHSCYVLTITNTQSGQSSQCTGSVIRTNKWCWKPPPCCFGPIDVGTAVTMTFDVSNTGDTDNNFEFKMNVMGPDMEQDMQAVSLNGLPPGTRYIGNLTVPPGGSTQVPVTVRFLEHVPFAFYDLVVAGDEDGDGDPSEIVVSKSMHSGPKPYCPADIAPVPGGNSLVNSGDLLAVINSWGPCPPPPANCPADIAPAGGDGQVNTADLLLVINSWGQCQ